MDGAMRMGNREFCSFFILASGKKNDTEQDFKSVEKRKKYVFNELNKAYSEAEKSYLKMLEKYGELKSQKISFEDYFELDSKDIEKESAREISFIGKYHMWKWQYESSLSLDFCFVKCNRKIYKVYKKLINNSYESEDRIWVDIEIEKIYSKDENDEYDIDFENLKIAIKNFWLESFGRINDKVIDVECFWRIDEQSKELSTKSYMIINILENRLRTLINVIMARELGACWFLNFGGKPTKTSETRKGGYEADVEIFANVNNYLASMNSDDLCKILQYEEYTSKEMQEGDLDDEINIISKVGSDKAVEILNRIYGKIKKSKKSFWSEYFAEYFDFPLLIGQEKKVICTEFVNKWEEFCKKRNHVAHNKYIGYQFYVDLLKASKEISRYLDDAYSIIKDNQECLDRDAYRLETQDDSLYVGWSYEDVLPSAPREYLLRSQRETDLLRTLLMRFWSIRDTLINEYKVDNNFVINDMLDEKCCDVWRNNSDDKAFQGLSKLILNLYREEICIMEYKKYKLTMIRGKYRENDNELGYMLKLYASDEVESSVNCYFDAFCFHCNGVYEEDEFLGGEFARFCSQVECAFWGQDCKSPEAFLSEIDELKE